MGDRVSISFKNEQEESVALFYHWGGVEFPKVALAYAKEYAKANDGHGYNISTPTTRLEPSTIMVRFIHDIKYNDSIYLGKDENDGDNSDNGHYIIDLKSLKLVRK